MVSTLLSTAVLATSVLGSTAWAAARTDSTVTLTLYTSGDVNVQQLWESDLIPLYEKAHPNVKINVVYSAHGVNDGATQDKIIAASQSGNDSGFDIIDSGIVTNLAQANVLQKLSTAVVPNLSKIDPQLLKQTSYEGMPYRASSVVLAYNSDFVKQPPTTLSGLINWIKANPGKFTYNSPNTGGSGSSFVTDVVRSQMPANKRFFMINGKAKNLEVNWKPGLDLLHSLNPYVYRNGFYPNGNTAVLQLLASQSIWVAPVWSDQSLTALSQNQLPPSIKLIQLTPPFNGGPADIGVVNTSQHKQAADDFLNWLLNPQAQTIVIHQMHGYPGVAWKYVPASVQKEFASISGSYQAGFSSYYSNDLNQKWQNQVAAQTAN